MKNNTEGILIELTVNNHPGVMSHICGLFSRRAYNLEKILCFPMENMTESKMWLLVKEESKLDQVIKQVEKLEDVRRLEYRRNSKAFFVQLEKLIENY
ncbi:ACT domain-containing protein [Desulfopila inferna]|uniref:ACT domain-containing protein n=1 Tax=Desulfopila inferna TaxID=468528 RepID=UPI0019636BA4|nr:ACT domain-containing protein [Desulfopila inferna]MBM9604937.1 ACT domain-containing protein [Desulfopila inferna]